MQPRALFTSAGCSALSFVALLVLALLVAIPRPATASLTPSEQRQAYLQALDHLSAGRSGAFRRARTALADYVLAPYLDYHQVRRRLSTVSDEEMRAFLADHQDLPAASVLYRRWLGHLGAQRQWQRLLANYTASDDAELHCYRQRALLATGRADEALDGVAPLWTVPYSQPKACDPLFDAWIAAGRLTEERAWERLGLALEAGQRRLGRYLLRFFEGPHEVWAKALYEVHGKPESLTRPGAFPDDSPHSRVVIAHGLKRLARNDPAAAAEAWQRYQDSHRFSTEEAQSITEALLLAEARSGVFPPHRLQGLSPAFTAAMAELAIQAQRWSDVVFYVEQLPPEERQDLRWQYWLARALSHTQLGSERARLTFETLAAERNYYGFLAAAHLGREPRLNPAPTRLEPDELRALERLPAVARALELYAVGDALNARREWFALLPRLTPSQQYHAAMLAQESGWIAQSIITANAADLRDNLELRFPVAYADVFQRISDTTSVPQPFLMAVARQESAFDPRARSVADARGLMQLLPPTASLVATRIGLTPPSTADLYDPAVNVSLGGHHLARLLARYGNRRPLAAAAYNAGEHRVDRWVAQHDGTPMDVWIETIPFRETRDYVKNVLAFTQVYSQLLGVASGPMLEGDEAVIN